MKQTTYVKKHKRKVKGKTIYVRGHRKRVKRKLFKRRRIPLVDDFYIRVKGKGPITLRDIEEGNAISKDDIIEIQREVSKRFSKYK